MTVETPAPLGLGTYRVRPPAIHDAVLRAADDPRTAWVDTAPNYLGGRAQTLMAPALRDRLIKVSTKVGFVAKGTGTMAITAGALSADEAAFGHCLTTRFVHWQCAQNRTQLGRPRLDMVFAHNPERAAGNPNEALLRAFTALEEQVSAGTLDAYGVATWEGFKNGALSVPHLDQMAARAAGSEYHHLRAVQLPISLVTADAFTQALDNRGPIAQAAERGWDVFASAPLFGGELNELATPELTEMIHPDLNVSEACLLAVASCPGVTRVLLSASESAHWYDSRAALAEPPVPVATLRKVFDVLASD